MIDNELKTIGNTLTGLTVKLTNQENTSLITYWDIRNGQITKQYINFNKKEIDNEKMQNKNRGFCLTNKKITYTQILLHEIAHYKQYKKCKNFRDYNFKYLTHKRYYEKLADRYALRYYKRFI